MSNIAGHFQHPLREREQSRAGAAEVNGIGGGRRERESAAAGGAPIHQRPSTLAFPPLSFFSAFRAPSFRVTSALFHPSPTHPPTPSFALCTPQPPPSTARSAHFLPRRCSTPGSRAQRYILSLPRACAKAREEKLPLIALSEFITSNPIPSA